MHNQKLREKIFSDIQEYWLSVEYMENLDLGAISKIVFKKELNDELRMAAFKYLSEYYENAREESDIWTDDFTIQKKTYSFNIFESNGELVVVAYPVIPNGEKYTREDTDKGVEILRIKEVNVDNL